MPKVAQDSKKCTQQKYPVILLRVDEDTMKLLDELKEKTGLSIREILGHSSKPCDCCRNTEVIAYDSKDKTVGIRRGILFKSLQAKHGSYDASKRKK